MAIEFYPNPPSTPRHQPPTAPLPTALSSGSSGRGGVYGRAGGGLAAQGRQATWAANEDVARIGGDGEKRTAALLDRYATEGGVAVLHDVLIPTRRITANIDHVVVAGSTVYLVDTKVWKPGRYWTLFGRTRRGWARFPHADKKTMAFADEDIERFLRSRGIENFSIARPLLVVWPSSTLGSLNLSRLRVAGADAMSGARFATYAQRHFAKRLLGGATPADGRIVAALADLLESRRPHQPHSKRVLGTAQSADAAILDQGA
jgi:hypothetical protein